MIRSLLRIAGLAISIALVLPFLFKGIQFHGGILAALGVGIFFTLLYSSISAVLNLVVRRFTGGLDAIRELVWLWIALFWAVSAGLLKLTAVLVPALLTVNGWAAVIGGGLILLFIGMTTARTTCDDGNCSEAAGCACDDKTCPKNK